MVSTPSFKIWQSDEDVFIQVNVQKSEDDQLIRIVVDNGNIFGLAGSNAYLPLIFEENSLQNGMISWNQTSSDENPPLTLKRVDDDHVLISLRKTNVGKQIENLDQMKPSVFDVPKTGDEAHDEEERLAGLEMLQRGIDAMNSNDQGKDDEETSVPLQPFPSTPIFSDDSTKSLVHEWRNGDASKATFEERKKACEDTESEKWDEGTYLYNFVDEQKEIEECLRFKAGDLPLKKPSSKSSQTITVTDVQGCDAHLLLMELLLAHAYDRRATLGDPNVESGWTIAKLCRSLVGSCLPSSEEGGDSAKTTLRSSIRRQLCYTLYRHWDLSVQVAKDVSITLEQPNTTLACLYQIQSTFQQSNDDPAFELYLQSIIDPLIYWFETLFTPSSLPALAYELRQSILEINKEFIGPSWNLEGIEEEARNALARGETGYFY